MNRRVRLPPDLARYAAGGAPPGAQPGTRLPSLGGAHPAAQPVEAPPPQATQVVTGDAGKESEVAFRPGPLLTGGLVSVYTTQRRWKGIDVYLDTGGLAIGGNDGNNVVCALFAIAQGVRTLVATGRMSFAEGQAGWRTKHMIAYRGGAAERFEVHFGSDFIPAPGTMQLAIVATDEVVEVDGADCDEVGTVLVDGTVLGGGNGASVVNAISSTLAGSIELRGVVAATVPGVAAATPRFLHIHDAFAGTPVNGLRPLFSFGMTDGGRFYTDPKFVTHRFVLAIKAVISTTAATTTLIGAEDSGASMIAYR